MKWVVDTCVIIDVLRGDDEFSELSADAFDAKMKDGLWCRVVQKGSVGTSSVVKSRQEDSKDRRM